MFMWMADVVGLLIPILVNVAFLTLLERKVLGLSQARKGPNKVSVGGILQPVSDAVKLFSKESFSPLSGSGVFSIAPGSALFLSLMAWILMPGAASGQAPDHSLLFLLVILSLGLYPLLLAGWSSNSKYAMVGALRGVAQTISYEISLAILALSVALVLCSPLLESWAADSPLPWAPFLPLLPLWLVSCVAETNRTPFDFAEGESELVSGFNTEFGAGLFALIFMAEYGSIMALSGFTALLTLGAGMGNSVALLTTVLLAFVWVWARATLPRFRYDKLMSAAWKSILPGSLGCLSLSCGIL